MDPTHDPMEPKTLGERIAARMNEVGIKKIAHLAKAAGGVTRSRLSQLQTTDPNGTLSYENMVSVARALGVTPEWLATGRGQKIASKTNNPDWTAKWTESQKQLLQDVMVSAIFLSEHQCRAFSELIKGAARGLTQQEDSIMGGKNGSNQVS